jgi:hypothetical protein
MEKNELFVDGLGKTIFGYPVSKLTFFSVSDIEKTEAGEIKEKREDVIRLTMMTNTLLELCLKTIENFYNNKDSVEAGSESFKKKFDDLVVTISDKNKK